MERKTLLTGKARRDANLVHTGRPKGARNKTNILMESVLRAKADGQLPHEFLLEVARGQPIRHGKDNEDGTHNYYTPDFAMRLDAAKAAAPYYAPKLSTVEVVKGMDDDVLDQTIAGLAREAGITITVSGEGTEEQTTISDPAQQRAYSALARRALLVSDDEGPSTE